VASAAEAVTDAVGVGKDAGVEVEVVRGAGNVEVEVEAVSDGMTNRVK